jgi:hypothetical protein
MPDGDRHDVEDEKLQEQLYLRQRRAINNAYAALQGRNTANSFSAFTFEEAADAQIELIEGADTQVHPNKLNRVAKIRGDLEQAVEELKQVPPEQFLDVNYTQSANTPGEDDDFWGEDSSVA